MVGVTKRIHSQNLSIPRLPECPSPAQAPLIPRPSSFPGPSHLQAQQPGVLAGFPSSQASPASGSVLVSHARHACEVPSRGAAPPP